jgi:hypothetical protein
MEFLIIATLIGFVFFPRVTLTCILFHYSHYTIATLFCIALITYQILKSKD